MTRKQTVTQFQEADAAPAVLPSTIPIGSADAPPGAVPDVRYITAMALEELFESPMNPRQRFDAAGLEDLTASIREKGVLTPLLARPVPGWSETPGPKGRRYELAAGARRSRAARAAGLATVPVMAREMTDAELLEILVIENDQREDVHPLEEAAGFQALIAKAKYDVARIAERLGRSVKYVYDRVKLLSLTKEAQRLFLEGRFSAGHAILLARLSPTDQERAIGDGKDPYDSGALFTGERGLFDGATEEAIEEAIKLGDRHAGTKPISVRELQAWIDEHVKADREAVDPVLFPETAARVLHAHEQGLKIIPIMNLSQTPPDARGQERIYTEASWKRADGEKGSKHCDHQELGVVTIGPGRYESFLMCRKKDRCAVHWAVEIKARTARQKAATKAVAKCEDPRKAEERMRQEQAAARDLESARWEKAQPAIWAALAAAVKKAPVRAGGLLAQTLVKGVGWDDWMARELGFDPADLVPPGKTVEDLVRHVAFLALAREMVDDMGLDGPEFVKRARAFGVDVRAIVDQVAPAEKVQTSGQHSKPVRGTCRKCGCQENWPCAGGCGWSDRTETRCTACFSPTLQSRGKKKAKKGGRA